MIKEKDLFLLKFIADSLINEVIDIVFAVREINSILQDYDDEFLEITNYFYYLETELEFAPIVKIRKNFSKDFLKKSDLKLQRIIESEYENLLEMCKKILSI